MVSGDIFTYEIQNLDNHNSLNYNYTIYSIFIEHF